MADSATQRPRRAVFVVVGAVLLLVLTTVLAFLPRPPFVEVVEVPPVLVPTEPIQTSSVAPPSDPPQSEEPLPEIEPFNLPDWLPDLIRLAIVILIVAAIAWFVRRLWETRISTERHRAVAPSGDAVEIVDLDEDEVAETVEEAIASLRRGIAVDEAVVECWRRLESLAADTGIRRRRSQTSEEFTVDVLARGGVDERSIRGLGDLYRQAMFSTHELTDDDRERAIAALEALSAQLRNDA